MALVVSACASHAPSSTDGGPRRVAVTGSVTAGPTCPVERVGHPCPRVPVRGSVIATGSKGDETETARIRADGHYALSLLPDAYSLKVETGGLLPRCPEVRFELMRDRPRRVDVACDTGIR